MNPTDPILPLIAVVGPTASGKSALGVWLAERFNGEVLACDSTQLYRGFDVGTAKPGATERRSIPHHLIDVLSPIEVATAGGYRQMALAALADLGRRGRMPILTVGTGLYLRALLEGLAEVPQRSEELRYRLRASAKEQPPGYLHRLLARLDPEAAAKIAGADEQKLIRAIEICLLARRPISKVHRSGRNPLEGWRPLKIGLLPPREALYARIDARVDFMLACGWMEEVRGLLATSLPHDTKPFEFIGYRELSKVVRGETEIKQARLVIQQATRRYAKRQLTWFRKEPKVYWLSGFGDHPDVQSAALKWLCSRGVSVARAAEGRGV